VEVRALADHERDWLRDHLALAWGSPTQVSRGRVRDASRLPALVSVDGEELRGLATLALEGEEAELVTIEAFRRREGIGSALLAAVIALARAHGCRRLALVTTNDNLAAQAFYERHGFALMAIHAGAVERARAIKPEIPLLGDGGVAIRDEVEFRLLL